MTVKTDTRFNRDNEVGSIIAEQGYEWDEFHAWFYDGRLWWATAGGCSCDSWADRVEDGDIIPEPVASTHDLFRAASKYKDETSGVDIDDYTRFVIQVNTRMKELAAKAGVQ